MYLVIKRFIDLEHGKRYELGEEYPAQGYETTPERIADLSSGNNKAGLKLIKEVKAPKEAVKEEPKEEAKPKKKSPKKTGGKKKASK